MAVTVAYQCSLDKRVERLAARLYRRERGPKVAVIEQALIVREERVERVEPDRPGNRASRVPGAASARAAGEAGLR